MNTPIGDLCLETTSGALASLSFDTASDHQPDSTEILDVIQQLTEYFAGKRVNFNLKIQPDGTLFQKQVWEEMQKIPFGEVASYAEIAKRIGRPEAWRAVANACAANPIVIIIPCHRVVGSHGKLGGYSGGLERKKWLLDHEAAVLSRILRK